MKILALTVALLVAASPVAAQQQRQQALGAGGQTNNSILPNNICIEEMVATFCNQPTGPNLAGYGSSTASSGSSATSGTSAASGSSAGAGVGAVSSSGISTTLHLALRVVSAAQRIVQLTKSVERGAVIDPRSMRQANDGPHFCDMVGLGFPASAASDTLSDGVSRSPSARARWSRPMSQGSESPPFQTTRAALRWSPRSSSPHPWS